MKKLMITSLLVFGLSQTTFAQGKGALEGGLQLGYNGANLSDNAGSSDTASGFNAGVSAEYYFNESLGLKVRVLYDQKGGDNIYADFGDASGPVYTNFNLDYISVPVTANWHFGRKYNWYMNAGAYLGFLVKAEESVHGYDLKDGIESTEFGLAVGIGVKIPLTDKLRFFIEFDGQGGFTDVSKQPSYYGDLTGVRSSLNIGLNFLMK